MRQLSIAREEIAAEKETARFAKVAGMPCGMARQMNRPEPAQNGKNLPIFDPPIRGKRLKTQYAPAQALKSSRNPIKSPARRATEIALAICLRPGNPCAVLPGDRRGIQDMIEMTMSQENAPNRQRAPPFDLEGSFHRPNGSDKSRVDEVEPVGMAEDVVHNPERPNCEDVR